MYLVLVRELEGRERVIFEGVAMNHKQADYMYKALAAKHPEPTIYEYQLMRPETIAVLKEEMTL